ncbi:antitoxin VbhA family protein [Pseudomonas brassicacearum]|uniref:antitoxin VbhA family protein n=1 Tax=Pseudomonas brassicacearum TaxID=930166 RepID=UPI0006407988|nr:antitoxin VbhA family protein [Pseudomonas brassicacearum]
MDKIHHPQISDAERRRREEAVNYARSSVGLEGFQLSNADEKRARRFINGEIDLTEFVECRDGAS